MMPSSNSNTPRSKVFLGPKDTQEAFLDENGGNFRLAEKPVLANENNANLEENVVFLGPDEVRERKLRNMPSQLKYSENSKAINPNEHAENSEESRVFLGTDKTQEALLSEMSSKLEYAEKKQIKTQAAIDNAENTTVFLGIDSTRERTLNSLADNLKWTEKAKDEYLQRVKAKATQGVKTLLLNAQKKADEIVANAHKEVEAIQEETKNLHTHANKLVQEGEKAKSDAQNTLAEAANIKDKAYDEGYTAGLHQAQLHLEEAKKEISQSVSNILLSMHGQCITIFNSWREDLVSLLHEAVETSTGYIMETEKKALLKNVLESSVNALLNTREYQVRANPNDALLLTEILEHAQNTLRQNHNWNLISDEQVEEGSVIVESPSGVIKNTNETRNNLVRQILDQLTLPLSDGDQIAYDNISQTLVEEAEKVNIPLHSEEEQTQEIPAENADNNNAIQAEQVQIPKEESSIPSEQANLVQNELNLDDSEVFSPENSLQEDIMKPREALINQEAEQAISAQNQPQNPQAQNNIEAPVQAQPQLSPEQKAENLASELVEKDLNFEALDGFIENDTPKASQSEAPAPPQSRIIKRTSNKKLEKQEENKPEYTPELADELLNEMGLG